MRRLALACVLLTAIAAPAHAAADPVAEMAAKKAEQAKAADAELSHIYKQLLSLVNATELKKLAQAQSAWMKYRDLECAYEAELGQGYAGLPDALRQDCYIRLTRVRAEELKNQLSTKQR